MEAILVVSHLCQFCLRQVLCSVKFHFELRFISSILSVNFFQTFALKSPVAEHNHQSKYIRNQSRLSALSSSKDLEFRDAHIDVASSDKRLVRVTTNTCKNSGITYINLFKKKNQDEYHLQHRVGLTVKEFQEIVANVENISMGPLNSGSRGVEKNQEDCFKLYGGC